MCIEGKQSSPLLPSFLPPYFLPSLGTHILYLSRCKDGLEWPIVSGCHRESVAVYVTCLILRIDGIDHRIRQRKSSAFWDSEKYDSIEKATERSLYVALLSWPVIKTNCLVAV